MVRLSLCLSLFLSLQNVRLKGAEKDRKIACNRKSTRIEGISSEGSSLSWAIGPLGVACRRVHVYYR